MIGLLLRSQLRFGLRAPFSTLSALLGLTLGIASLVAVHLICERIVDSLDRAIPSHLRSASHLAFADGLSADDYFALRARWRAGELPDLLGLAPLRQGQLEIEERAVTVFGLDWLALPPGAAAGRESGNDAASTGAALPLGSQVIASDQLGWQISQTQRIGDQLVTVAGVVETPQGLPLAPALYADIALAVQLLGANPEALSAVLLQVDDPLAALRDWLAQLLPGVDAGLPALAAPALGPRWQVRALAAEMPEQVFGRSVLFNIGALGTLSLVVAWFLMFQTAMLWLRRQVPVFALLRDQGVGQGAQFLVFALTMLLLGLVAGAVGLVLGYWLAETLMGQLAAAAGPPAGAGWLLGKATVSAAVIPLLCAALAWRLVLGPVAQASKRWLPLLLVVSAAVLAGWLALRSETGLLGGFAAILLTCGIAVAVLPLVIAGLRRRAMTPRSLTAAKLIPAGWLNVLMGARELVWFPRELSAALGALSLAVATSIGISTMVESFRDDFVQMLDQRLVDDVGIDADAKTLVTVANALNSPSAQVQTLYRYEQARLRVAGQPIVIGRSLMDARGAGRYGLPRALAAQELMLNQRASRALDLGVGDQLRLGGQTFTIAHVFPGYGDTQLRALTGRGHGDLRDSAGAPLVFELSALGVATAAPEQLVTSLQAAFPTLNARSQQEVRRRSVAVFDQTFAITRSLTLVALLVAAVGLYSALVALGLTQARTRTLLQYLGQSPLERLLYVCGRALAVALVTLVVAIPLGLTIAALLCYVVNPRGFGWSVPLQLQWQSIVWPLLLALGAALAAGLMGDRSERL